MISDEAKEILGEAADGCHRQLTGVPDPVEELRGAAAAMRAGDAATYALRMSVARTTLLALREAWSYMKRLTDLIGALGEPLTPEDAAASTSAAMRLCGAIVIRNMTDAEVQSEIDSHCAQCHDPRCEVEPAMRAALRERQDRARTAAPS